MSEFIPDAAALPQLEPSSLSEPEDALPRVALGDLPAPVCEGAARAGWQSLMPVQSLALPYLLQGRDIMVQSRTGSGKTGCYLLPMLMSLDPRVKAPQALVLVPTRELAVQVEREAATVFAETGLRSVAVYGGVGYKKQMDALSAGAQFIVGTPGRVLDHLLRRTMSLERVRVLVFDEADRMLSIGFYPDMKEVQRYLPNRRVHVCLFSATYPPHVLKLAAEFMESPSLLSLSHRQVHVAQVQHLCCQVKPMDKDRALVRLLETENPASALIFCNTKANVQYVTGVLQGFGYNADALSADLSQARREAVLNRLREGNLHYLVATDVAARGIDIPALSHVFLYEIPEDHENYIHRAGRTGRAGAAGTVISLVDVVQRMDITRIARHYGIMLEDMPLPTDEEVAKASGARLTAFLEARLRALTGLERLRAERFAPVARELAESVGEEEGVLPLSVVLDDFYRRCDNRFPDAGPARRREAVGALRAGRRRGRGRSGQRGKSPFSGRA
ncbi:MAG: ATP-dependent RNA helicase DbpA [Candidatus Desulfovibrio kirbyi]|uniref:ATP-dependent RNA helicase DbpA n=1 Tax=Candidatus Desulfovibrio kirbyi TaxID=2696086 RepID=A0A6L2R6N8_9BACT|nr:MAG: ATP-dependent RNA helicase DbpA [Candidatus Desulfovibrio kirbyi]